MHAAILSLTAVALVAAAVTVSGASPSAAVLGAEFQAGVDAYRLGKYDEAQRHLERAQAIDPTLPGPHRFLAAVARARHRWVDCIAEARRALELNPRSHEIMDTRRLHDACRVAAGRPAYRGELDDSAALAVTASVSGAIVRVDGLRYGATPMAPRRIKPGVHELQIDKPGYRTAHRAIDALSGIVTDVELALEPAAPATSTRQKRSSSRKVTHERNAVSHR